MAISSLPMDKLRCNCYSYSLSESLTSGVTSSTERRRAVPWLMLPPESSVYKFYRLAEGDVIQVEQPLQVEPEADSLCLGSPFQGWLLYIQRKDCQLFLFNPLSGKTFNLPSIQTLPYCSGVIRNSHSGLVEFFIEGGGCGTRTPERMSNSVIQTMVLSSSPMDDDCIAMVICAGCQQLAFCRRPHPGDDVDFWAWTVLHGSLQDYNELVFDSQKNLFFAFTETRELEAWDLHTDPVKSFLIKCEDFGSGYWPTTHCREDDELEQMANYCTDIDFLVYDHQSWELFIVTRYVADGIDQDGTLVLFQDNFDHRLPYKTRTFDVFKLNFIDHDQVELESLDEGNLGDRAFFIGSNPGFALSTTEFPELRPNSIYFTDTDQQFSYDKRCSHGGHDLGIYDYKERIFLSCYYPIDLDKIQRIVPPPIWFTSDV